MTTYYIQWQADGLATIEADNEDEARDIASRALFGIHPFDFDTCDVDGIEYEVGTDQL